MSISGSNQPFPLNLNNPFNYLNSIFQRMPMGVAIFDREHRIQQYNETWGNYSKLYSPHGGTPLQPGVGYFEHLPGTEATVLPLFERVLAGETIQEIALRLDTGDNIVSYWDVVIAPLVENGEVIGMLNVTIDATERVQLQQNLEQRVEERTNEIQTLLRVSQEMSSTLELESLLELVLEQLKLVVDYTGASILTLDKEILSVRAYRGPIPIEQSSQLRFPLENALVNREVIRRQEPICIEDIRTDSGFARMFQQTAGDQLESTFGYVRSWLGVPLMSKGKILGMLTLDHAQPNFFTPQHADLVLLLANQAAVAIENARLVARAEEAAIAAERNRLARDLHDAVTQTLFSSTLIADVLPKIWERDPEAGQRKLEELRQLTRGALSEMRTLLVELRPAALVDTDLGDLIGHQVNALIARTRTTVEFKNDCLQPLPTNVKETFYRIAQETFNNIGKHAQAALVTVRLDCRDGCTTLDIRDDGIGFDMAAAMKEGLGLNIMEERARGVGARFELISKPQEGTRVHIEWKDPAGKQDE